MDGELQIPLLTNYDSNEEEQYKWMLEKLPKAIGLKNGMFSHGYHISDAQERLANFIDFRNAVEESGKVFFARGEQDAEYRTYGWSTQNIAQAFYWSALYATHCGLTLWNVRWEAAQIEENFPALELFNRYAAQVHPQTARYAFCALRRGLDASDTIYFPESTYGKANKQNVDRYVKITEAFSDYGAQMGDPEKATGGGMINRKRQDYNDAGWKILTGNYQRHLTQIEPEETSVAWWSSFTKNQMYTFITLRALSASPLMMGGDIPTLDDFSLKLITNKEMLDCNQNGVMGTLVYDQERIEVWKTPQKKSSDGWIGVFNRATTDVDIPLSKELLGLESNKTKIYDIWAEEALSLNETKNIPSNGVIFIKYSEN
jgi:hypothetical protein